MSLNSPTGHPFHLARHLLLGLLALSPACGDQGPPGPVPVATLGQGLDSDSDGMDDAWETTYFGNLSRNGTGDYDSDGMTDLEEYQNTFDPTVDDGLDDADFDRYPNVFEVRRGSNPNSAASTPTANYVVDVNGGGNYTTVKGAVDAATTANGNYQVIAVSPGVYSGTGNINFTIASTKPKLLIIGTSGAAATIVDGGGQSLGWTLSNTVVLASLTFRKTTRALYVNASGHQVRLIDLFFWKNAATGSNAGAVHEVNVSKLFLIGCTLLDNTTTSGSAEQIYLTNGTDSLINTVVYGASSGTMLYKHPTNVTFSASYSLVKGMTLSGTGNLSSTTDPKLRFDGHVDYDSPLIGAGGAGSYSATDLDLDARGSPPGIGADEWVDTDSDSLADFWELAEAGNLTTLTSLTQDQDSDGRTNNQEYLTGTKPTDSDTDDDGLSDGGEASNNTDPFDSDSDDDDLPDGWEVSNSLDPLTVSTYDDDDHDRYPAVYEYAGSTDPQSAASTPSADLIVDQDEGGTSGTDNIYSTVSEAFNAATTSNGTYQILAIHPGVYQGASNTNLSLLSTKPRLLIIGTGGAAATIVDGEDTRLGWTLTNSGVVSSITFENTTRALHVNFTSAKVHLVDLFVYNNRGTTSAGGLQVSAGISVNISGCTFLENTTSTGNAQQIYFGQGTNTITNTAVWGASSGTSVAKFSSASWTWSYSLAKGQTLSGTGNLSGSTDPKLRFDGHVDYDSPLIAAGTSGGSATDLDLETRASPAAIGADEWIDSDSDSLADFWELAAAGNLTTLTGRTQDADSDGLTNGEEYPLGTSPITADSDGDGVSDGDEVDVHGSDPLDDDTDDDDMPDGWEVDNELDPVVADRFEDADGDRYPNVFEYARSTDPQDAESVPDADLTVDPAQGGASGTDTIYTTVGAAFTAADVANGAYQIVEVVPGTYAGSQNVNLSLSSSKPKLLIIGLGGARQTIIDGGETDAGWTLSNSVVIESLTFQRTTRAFFLSAPSQEIRLVDLMIQDNAGTANAGGLNGSFGRLDLIGSTFLNNTTDSASAQQISLSSGVVQMTSTVLWGASSGTMLYTHPTNVTFTASYSFVKGMTLSGTGNLSGSTDPELRIDGRLLPTSPLRGAGASSLPVSAFDWDLDERPANNPDIGVDQWGDTDQDGLPDVWEVEMAGSLMTLSGGDYDNDGLSDLDEYTWLDANTACDPLNPDTDGDLVADGLEVLLGTSPIVKDTDLLTTDLNEDGLIDALGFQLGYLLSTDDDDGDSILNADERAQGTDPLRADTDGDGYDDDVDAFPLDPLSHALESGPGDSTAPVITLTAPQAAVLQ